MYFKIPELSNYVGSKGNNGVHQNIISHIPVHDVLVIPFLGHCSIVRNIISSSILICVDASADVVEAWRSYLVNNFSYVPSFVGSDKYIFTGSNKRVLAPIIYLICDDSLVFLKFKLRSLIPINMDKISIYLDPPYLLSSRVSSVPIYVNEFSEKQHIALLNILSTFTNYHVIISSYRNDLYDSLLSNWSVFSFNSSNRVGSIIETIYYNFSLDDVILHDYSFIGGDYRGRERIKLIRNRFLSKINSMSKLERESFLFSLRSSYPTIFSNLNF